MSNASNKAIVFPPTGGIAFHHFQESDEIKKNPINLVNPVGKNLCPSFIPIAQICDAVYRLIKKRKVILRSYEFLTKTKGREPN